MQRRGGNEISFGEAEKPSVTWLSGGVFADAATGITITILRATFKIRIPDATDILVNNIKRESQQQYPWTQCYF